MMEWISEAGAAVATSRWFAISMAGASSTRWPNSKRTGCPIRAIEPRQAKVSSRMSSEHHLEETEFELGEHLWRAWPDATDIDRDCVSAESGQREFIAAITAMRDEGHLMYEVLMFDVYGRPRVVDAVLTQNGRDWIAAHWQAEQHRLNEFDVVRPGTL